METYIVYPKGSGVKVRMPGQKAERVTHDYSWIVVRLGLPNKMLYECKFQDDAKELCVLLEKGLLQEVEEKITKLIERKLARRID